MAGTYRGHVAETPRRAVIASSLRKMASDSQAAHPETASHLHYRDAARSVEEGDYETAQEHLRAAMFHHTPQSLHRSGIHDDAGHVHGRQAMQGAHRHLLLVKGLERVSQRNQANAESRRAEVPGAGQTGMPAQGVAAGGNGYGPGALAARPVPRPGGPGRAAVNAPKAVPAGKTGKDVASPDSPEPRGSKQIAAAGSWDELAALIDLSARTAMLERTPAPRGAPGGPGLYDVKGQGHSAYFQQVVKALIEKRGMPPEKAYPIAWAALRKWRAGGGKVHPEVRAAAGGALAEEAAKQHGHSHANGWDELAGVIELFNPAQPRVQAGSATGGQFAPPGGPAASSQKATPQNAKAKQKAALLAQAKADRLRAAGILKQITALDAIVHAAQKGTGKTVKAGARKTGSAAPAKKGAPAAKGPAATAQQAQAAGKAAAAAAKPGAHAAAKTAKRPTAAQAAKALPGLRAQYRQLMQAAAKATAQAAHLANDGPAVELAAAGGHHIPGTPYDWRHEWHPLTESAAKSHFGGKVPSGWHPSGGKLSAGKPEEKVMGTGNAVRSANVERARTGYVKRGTRQSGRIGGGMAVAGGVSDVNRPIAEALTSAVRTGHDHYVIPTMNGMASTSAKPLQGRYIKVTPAGEVSSWGKDLRTGQHHKSTDMPDEDVSKILDEQLSKTRQAEPETAKPVRPAAKPGSKYTRKDIARTVRDVRRIKSLQNEETYAKVRKAAADAGASDLIPDSWGGKTEEKVMQAPEHAAVRTAVGKMRQAVNDAVSANEAKPAWEKDTHLAESAKAAHAALDALEARSAGEADLPTLGKHMAAVTDALNGKYGKGSINAGDAARELDRAVGARQEAAAMKSAGLRPGARHLVVDSPDSNGDDRQYLDIRDAASLRQVAGNVAAKGLHVREAEGPPDLAHLPRGARNLLQHAQAHGWNTRLYSWKNSGGSQVHQVDAVNPETREKSTQTYIDGKRTTYNSESVTKSTARISAHPRQQYAAVPA